MDSAWIGSIDIAMKKAYRSRAFEGIMSETQIVRSAPGNLHNGIQMSAMSEQGSLLEELRTAYQGLGRKERKQVKSLLLMLSRSNSDSMERK